jgi:hypothetical protein
MDFLEDYYEKRFLRSVGFKYKLVPCDPKDMLGKPIFEDPIISKMKNI